LWGLQIGQMEYLSRADNRWVAGWWFVSTMGDGNNDNVCDQTAWLWRSDFDCTQNSSRPNNLSRAGVTHEQTLDCLFNNNNCPTASLSNSTAGSSVTSLPPLAGPHCKATNDLLCVPQPPPPPTHGGCGCTGNNFKKSECIQVICPTDQ
jgi:hypothetical protein